MLEIGWLAPAERFLRVGVLLYSPAASVLSEAVAPGAGVARRMPAHQSAAFGLTSLAPSYGLFRPGSASPRGSPVRLRPSVTGDTWRDRGPTSSNPTLRSDRPVSRGERRSGSAESRRARACLGTPRAPSHEGARGRSLVRGMRATLQVPQCPLKNARGPQRSETSNADLHARVMKIAIG